MLTTTRTLWLGALAGGIAGVTLGYWLVPERMERLRGYVQGYFRRGTNEASATGSIRVEVRDTPRSGWSENDLARADELMREANAILKQLKNRRSAPSPDSSAS